MVTREWSSASVLTGLNRPSLTNIGRESKGTLPRDELRSYLPFMSQ